MYKKTKSVAALILGVTMLTACGNKIITSSSSSNADTTTTSSVSSSSSTAASDSTTSSESSNESSSSVSSSTSTVPPITTYVVRFMNGSTVLDQQTVNDGDTPVYRGSTPTKASDETRDYAFKGWDKEIGPIHANTEFNATYNETRNHYVLYFMDGANLIATLLVAPNATVDPKDLPTIPSQYAATDKTVGVYNFLHWSQNVTSTPVTSDMQLTPVYGYDGSVAAVTYHLLDGATEIVTVAIGGGIEVPTPKNTRTKRFAGWYSDAAFATAVTGTNKLISVNTDYYGKFLDLDATAGSFKYTDNGDGTITVTGLDKTGREYVDIPAAIDGKKVTAIAANAFTGDENIYTVNVPEGVTSIGELAFHGISHLGYISLPSTLTTLGKGGIAAGNRLIEIDLDPKNANFLSPNTNTLLSKDGATLLTVATNGLASYTIPSSVTAIGDYAFYESNKFTFNSSEANITTIGDRAFYLGGCLIGTAYPFALDKITSIGELAFYMTRISEFIVYPSLTHIGEGALSACEELTSISLSSTSSAYAVDPTTHILYEKSTATAIAITSDRKRTTLTIPASIQKIGAHAFEGFEATAVTAVGDISAVGDHAFEGSDLASMHFTNVNGLISLGEACFKRTDNMKEITFSSGANLIIGAEAFMLSAIESFTITAGTTSEIGLGAFRGCYALLSFTVATGNENYSTDDDGFTLMYKFSSNATKTLVAYCDANMAEGATVLTETADYQVVGPYAFSLGGVITGYVASSNLHAVSQYGFAESSLESIDLEAASLEGFEDYAFSNCRALASLKVPAYVGVIGAYAFLGDALLTTINFAGSATDWTEAEFNANWRTGSSLTSITPATGNPIVF